MGIVALVVLLVVAAGCGAAGDPDREAAEQLDAVAAPLLTAHDRLLEYERTVVEGDHARALALWPEVAADVGAVLGAFDDTAAAGLGAAERAAVVGYVGGLRRGLEAWERVDAAIRAQDAGAPADVEAAVARARDHTRLLDRLREAAFP